MRSLSDVLARIERRVSQALVAAFVGLIVANVAMRYLADRPIVFAEELAAILLVWLAFVAISISIHDKAQIGVTLFTDRLRVGVRHVVDIAVLALVAGILATLLWASVRWVTSPVVAFEQVITTGWPKAPFFWIVPIFSLTALVHVLADLAEALAGRQDVELANERMAEL
ncbi:TRAP transporter small permease [Rhodobacteraceae bacterium DSL-40]|uniref:TRAP transporter small permease n=1 Tax=Amaricoccus sp. B4 TaxID=3368557 RepID=UPI000DAE4BDF